MTTTTAPSRPSKRSRSAGMTLVELMVAMTVSTMVIAALFSSWSFVGRSTVDMADYTQMNSTGRTGLEVFARDIRRARRIDPGFSTTAMTLEMEDSDGTRSKVYYSFNALANTMERQEGSGTVESVFNNVEWLEFSYFQTTGNTATNWLDTRLIQLELLMSRETLGRSATKKIVSARYIMRNKQHGP